MLVLNDCDLYFYNKNLIISTYPIPDSKTLMKNLRTLNIAFLQFSQNNNFKNEFPLTKKVIDLPNSYRELINFLQLDIIEDNTLGNSVF